MKQGIFGATVIDDCPNCNDQPEVFAFDSGSTNIYCIKERCQDEGLAASTSSMETAIAVWNLRVRAHNYGNGKL